MMRKGSEHAAVLETPIPFRLMFLPGASTQPHMLPQAGFALLANEQTDCRQRIQRIRFFSSIRFLSAQFFVSDNRVKLLKVFSNFPCCFWLCSVSA
jgi:hypothetical protein